MKTIQELYNEIMANKEMKAQFVEAAEAGKLEEVLKAQGCEATLEEVGAFLKAKSEEDAPLSLDELDNAAGGECNQKTRVEIVESIFSAGVICAIMAIDSTRGGSHIGQRNSEEGRICNND